MKPGVIIALFAIFLSVLSPQLYAENITDKLSYDGQIRWRFEIDKKTFKPAGKAGSFHDLRTRLGLKFKPTERILAYIQFQDSRRFGVKGSGDLQALDNVDLHQVYFILHNLPFENMHFKAGRFEVNYGNQRVFGAVGWHNIGRSWDGLMLSYEGNKIKIDVFDLKRLEEVNSSGSYLIRGKSFIIGSYISVLPIQLDMFFVYEDFGRVFGFSAEYLDQYSIGGFYNKKIENLDLMVQGDYQFGESKYYRGSYTSNQDISAFMAAAEVGYTFKTDNPLRLAAGIDYTTGNDDSDSTKFKAYQNDYYTGHAFRGYMDYFIDSPDHGLSDLMFRSSFKYQKDWMFKGDFHYFQAAEYYQSKSDQTIKTKDIGMEIDLTVINKSIDGATFTGGFSVFFADKHYAVEGDNRDPGLWAYFMTTINF